MAADIAIKGTEEERKTFTDVYGHYVMSSQDLRTRTVDFDKKDILFRSFIQKNDWPYRSLVFDPRVFTILYEKTARTFANKPRGRMQPRESGDALGAKINNELLNFQWDDNERVDGMPMLAKWSLMDLNARKYGASFGLAKWHWQRQVQRTNDTTDKPSGKAVTFFDGPNFKPWANRDVLHNPSYPTIKNWIQLRDYVTFQDLSDINDSARGKPVYKNLDILKELLNREGKKGGDQRASNYVVKNLSLKGLMDYLGQDSTFKTIELITEYRNERWITFSPKHGLILRDIPNPYKHGQIPVVMLKYYPIDDDLYGLSEIEPIERLQRALNAYINQNLDTLNLNTYVPLKVRNTQGAVQMHTLEFGPGKKWLMNDPVTDVVPHNQGTAGVAEFVNVYRLMVSAIQEAAGETSAAVSSLNPGDNNKTATEIRDLSMSRNARDNFNQIFLAEALKKQMMFWFKMNQQFLFSNPTQQQKVIQIVGKDAIKFFQNQGLDGEGLDDNAINLLSDPNVAATSAQPQDLMKPLFPVTTKAGIMPKLQMEPGGQYGKLIIEPEDLEGDYDYIPDVGSMSSSANDQQIKAKSEALQYLTGVDPKTGQPTGIAAMIAQEGKKIKATDLFIDYMEDIGFKNADQYIENQPAQNPMMMGGIGNGQEGIASQLGGAGAAQGGPVGMGNGAIQGMGGGASPVLNGQAQPVFPGPQQVH